MHWKWVAYYPEQNLHSFGIILVRREHLMRSLYQPKTTQFNDILFNRFSSFKIESEAMAEKPNLGRGSASGWNS